MVTWVAWQHHLAGWLPSFCCEVPTTLSAPALVVPRAALSLQANEILHHKLTLNGYLAEFTGQGMETITADTDRDFFMSAQEAVSGGPASLRRLAAACTPRGLGPFCVEPQLPQTTLLPHYRRWSMG